MQRLQRREVVPDASAVREGAKGRLANLGWARVQVGRAEELLRQVVFAQGLEGAGLPAQGRDPVLGSIRAREARPVLEGEQPPGRALPSSSGGEEPTELGVRGRHLACRPIDPGLRERGPEDPAPGPQDAPEVLVPAIQVPRGLGPERRRVTRRVGSRTDGPCEMIQDSGVGVLASQSRARVPHLRLARSIRVGRRGTGRAPAVASVPRPRGGPPRRREAGGSPAWRLPVAARAGLPPRPTSRVGRARPPRLPGRFARRRTCPWPGRRRSVRGFAGERPPAGAGGCGGRLPGRRAPPAGGRSRPTGGGAGREAPPRADAATGRKVPRAIVARASPIRGASTTGRGSSSPGSSSRPTRNRAWLRRGDRGSGPPGGSVRKKVWTRRTSPASRSGPGSGSPRAAAWRRRRAHPASPPPGRVRSRASPSATRARAAAIEDPPGPAGDSRIRRRSGAPGSRAGTGRNGAEGAGVPSRGRSGPVGRVEPGPDEPRLGRRPEPGEDRGAHVDGDPVRSLSQGNEGERRRPHRVVAVGLPGPVGGVDARRMIHETERPVIESDPRPVGLRAPRLARRIPEPGFEDQQIGTLPDQLPGGPRLEGSRARDLARARVRLAGSHQPDPGGGRKEPAPSGDGIRNRGRRRGEQRDLEGDGGRGRPGDPHHAVAGDRPDRLATGGSCRSPPGSSSRARTGSSRSRSRGGDPTATALPRRRTAPPRGASRPRAREAPRARPAPAGPGEAPAPPRRGVALRRASLAVPPRSSTRGIRPGAEGASGDRARRGRRRGRSSSRAREGPRAGCRPGVLTIDPAGRRRPRWRDPADPPSDRGAIARARGGRKP